MCSDPDAPEGSPTSVANPFTVQLAREFEGRGQEMLYLHGEDLKTPEETQSGGRVIRPHCRSSRWPSPSGCTTLLVSADLCRSDGTPMPSLAGAGPTAR